MQKTVKTGNSQVTEENPKLLFQCDKVVNL